MKTNKVMRVILDADLRSQHHGLCLIAEILGVKTNLLGVGEYVIFVNKRKTALKIYASGNVIAHFKTPDNRVMDMRIIAKIPQYFNGKKLDYDAATEALLKENIGFRISR